MKLIFVRAALIAALMLVAAACGAGDQTDAGQAGTDQTTTSGAPTTTAPPDDMTDDDMSGDMASHDHGSEVYEVMYTPLPSVSLTATADPKAGWNVHAVPTGHAISAEHASTDPIDGEGHMHLWIDGERIGRIYNEWVHVPDLEPGEHEIRVELSANNHLPLAVDGVIIDATVTVMQEAREASHSHDAEMVEASGTPSVTLEVFEDPKSGWNLHAVPSGFTLAPERASTEAVDGEGHMHIYVDGEKITRLYGEWYHLDGLEPGEHEIRVELSANNHLPIAIDGVPVTASTTIMQHGDATAAGHGDDDGHGEDTEAGHDAHADHVIEVAAEAGGLVGDLVRHAIARGETVMIKVTSDVTEEVHVHGYDVFGEVAPDSPAMIMFTADIPGIFEVELEGAGVPLLELEVS